MYLPFVSFTLDGQRNADMNCVGDVPTEGQGDRCMQIVLEHSQEIPGQYAVQGGGSAQMEKSVIKHVVQCSVSYLGAEAVGIRAHTGRCISFAP